MLIFNVWLRMTPFLPNWFCNLACPLVGVPLRPFFVASLFGTQAGSRASPLASPKGTSPGDPFSARHWRQGSLLFLTVTGATLRDLGESRFELGSSFRCG